MIANTSIHSIPNKGLGVVALRDFSAGELIHSEFPFVAINTDYVDGIERLDICQCCMKLNIKLEAVNLHLAHCKVLSTPERRTCRYGCGATYCCLGCEIASEFHICPTWKAFRALRECGLWKSPRFALFCAAATRVVKRSLESELDGEAAFETFTSFASPLLAHNQPQCANVYREFIRQSIEPVRILREVLLAHLCEEAQSEEARSRAVAMVERVCSPDQYECFWRVCAANAQCIQHPSLANVMFKSIVAGADQAAATREDYIALQHAIQVLPEAGFRELEGSALFPTLCRFNHDCDPNAEFSRIDTESFTSGLLGREGGGDGSGGMVGCYAKRFIARGEEICVDYLGSWRDAHVDPNGGHTSSHKHCSYELLERYGFTYQCKVHVA